MSSFRGYVRLLANAIRPFATLAAAIPETGRAAAPSPMEQTSAATTQTAIRPVLRIGVLMVASFGYVRASRSCAARRGARR
jgi:hypothetical protein